MELPDHPLPLAVLHRSLDELALSDPALRAALAEVGHPPVRQRPPGFATLLQIMVAQQLSTRAAAAIWARFLASAGPTVTPDRVLALDDAELLAAGFSRRKIGHARAAAMAVNDGRLDLDRLGDAPDEAVVAAISALPGFGRWSAEIYLLFALGRADVFPAGDLALQVGMQRLRGLERRPGPGLTRDLAAAWRPHRGSGAIFLWHLYGSATLGSGASPRGTPAATIMPARRRSGPRGPRP